VSRAPWIVGGASFALCVLLGAPGTTWHDGGELALAASTLGVAHPPGEPAYLVLAALAALLPVGDASFRLTLLSAATVAAAAGLLTDLTTRLARRAGFGEEAATWAGVGAGAALAVCPLVALQGVRPELYGLTLLGLLLGVAGLAMGGRRGVALAVLPLGVIGAVHHAILVAALPGLAVAALLRGRRAFAAGIATAVAFVLPALGQFAWLPMRSFTNPPIDFGTPRTLARVVWSVTGAGYARSFSSVDGGVIFDNLVGHVGLFLRGFGGVGLVLAGLGVVFALARPASRRLVGIGALIAGLGIAPTALQGLFVADNPDSAGYLLGVAAVLAAALGLGVAAIVDRAAGAAGPWVLRGLAGGVIVAAGLGPALTTVSEVDASRVDGPARLAAQVLDSAPPGALILLAGDGWVFPTLLARYREGRRADVHVFPLHMLEADAIGTLADRGLPVPGDLPPRALAAARAVRAGGCCAPEQVVGGLVEAGVATVVLVNETFLSPGLLEARRPRGLLYRLDPGEPWGFAPADIDAAVRAEDRLHADLTARALGGGADSELEGLLARRYIARAGFFRMHGFGPLARTALDRGAQVSRDPWGMVHLHRHRLEQGLAPVAPAPGSGRLPHGPWMESADVDAALTEALAAAEGGAAADLLALRGTIRMVNDDAPAGREDIAAVLRAQPDHPRALLAAERLFSLGLAVDVAGTR